MVLRNQMHFFPTCVACSEYPLRVSKCPWVYPRVPQVYSLIAPAAYPSSNTGGTKNVPVVPLAIQLQEGKLTFLCVWVTWIWNAFLLSECLRIVLQKLSWTMTKAFVLLVYAPSNKYPWSGIVRYPLRVPQAHPHVRVPYKCPWGVASEYSPGCCPSAPNYLGHRTQKP